MDVIALGELLIDFTDAGIGENGMRLFEQNPGGAPANVLAALSRLGKKTAFIGKVGNDMHGRFLRQTLAENGIDTSSLILDDDVFTTLAFVKLSAGEREFSFARKPGADTCLREDELDDDAIKAAKIFHFGSLSLTDEPARSATTAAIGKAKASGAIISYDPNYRATLWPGVDVAKAQMTSVLPLVDIMKFSDEEAALLTDRSEPEAALDYLLDIGIKIPVLTLGAEGALVATREGKRLVPTRKSRVVDTTGAGDSFWGGFLCSLIDSGLGTDRKPLDISLSEAVEAARMGNAVAGLCIEKRGAIPAMPTKAEVEARLAQQF